MNHTSITGPDLHRLNPLVFFEVGRDGEVQIWHSTVCWNRILLLHREDDVRLTDGPTFGELRCRRHVLVVAFAREPASGTIEFFVAERQRYALRKLKIDEHGTIRSEG